MVFDHSTIYSMKEIAISKFKAQCLGILEEVRKTRRPIRVTRFGKPVAEVVPPTPEKASKIVLGGMAGTARILGDIVGSISPESDWDAARK
jgi:prevent-host-death family protein